MKDPGSTNFGGARPSPGPATNNRATTKRQTTRRRQNDLANTCRILVWLVLCFSSFGAFAATNLPTAAATGFEAANKLYFEGKFNDAANGYEKIIQTGETSPALWYDLGNAWFKAGQLGHAIAAYRQAESSLPRDPDVRANLQFARSQVQGPSYVPNRLQRWLNRVTLDEWALMTSIALWLTFGLLIIMEFKPALARSIRTLLIVLGCGTLAFAACLYMSWSDSRAGPVAVVIAKDAVVRAGPLDESRNVFVVHDGAELLVLDHKDDWAQVRASAGQTGWVKISQLLIGAPGRGMPATDFHVGGDEPPK